MIHLSSRATGVTCHRESRKCQTLTLLAVCGCCCPFECTTFVMVLVFEWQLRSIVRVTIAIPECPRFLNTSTVEASPRLGSSGVRLQSCGLMTRQCFRHSHGCTPGENDYNARLIRASRLRPRECLMLRCSVTVTTC